mgnify:FL=1
MSVVNQPMPAHLVTRWMKTPLGPIEIAVKTQDDHRDVFWYFEFKQMAELEDSANRDRHELLDLAEVQLKEYFSGQRREFEALFSYLSDYGTEFQRQVWHGLRQVPYGETWSYGDLAKYIDKPKAVRAVGAANGRNPLAVVVPCHRVIGANGTLTGYAGGMDKKRWLLEFEASHSNANAQPGLF